MATQTIYAAQSATSNVAFDGGAVTHVLVLTDATDVVAIMGDASTVDYGDPLAGTVIAGSDAAGNIEKITFAGGTFRALRLA